MQLTLELTELKGVGRLHQEGFSIDLDGETWLRYCITVPSALPYIKVIKGPFAGRTFAVNPADMMQALEAAFFHPAAIAGNSDTAGNIATSGEHGHPDHPSPLVPHP